MPHSTHSTHVGESAARSIAVRIVGLKNKHSMRTHMQTIDRAAQYAVAAQQNSKFIINRVMSTCQQAMHAVSGRFAAALMLVGDKRLTLGRNYALMWPLQILQCC